VFSPEPARRASGCVLVFLIALGFYITPAMLGGLRDSMIAMLIESQITQLVNWGFAATAAVVLLAVTLAGSRSWDE